MRRGMAFGAFAIAMALFCILTSQAAVARTVLFLNSQKGDYIGGGKRQALTTANGTFTLTWLQDTLIVQFNSQNIWGDMSIEAPQGETLAVGLYEDAQRARLGSPKKPGFAFSLTGRGCNGVRARFLISDILIDSDRTVKRLAVDFEQHCGFSAPALYGSFRYNSSVSTEPRISIGGTTALKGNAGTSDATILASLSMPSSSVVKARYRTADGTALGGTDYTPVSGTVVFAPGVTEMPITVPVIGNRNSGGNRVFTVTLEGVGTPVSDGVADVQLFDPNVPTTVLTLNSQKGALVGTNPVTTPVVLG